MSEPSGLDAFISGPIEKAMPLPASDVSHGAPEPKGLDSFIEAQTNEKEFGTLPQQALTAVEGLGRGATLGFSDEALVAGGADPERIKQRMITNPKTAGLSQIGGGGALIAGTGGLGALAEGAGLAGTAAAYGGEGALFGLGNVISDHALGDPELNAQKIAAEVGMGTLLGVGFGLAGKGLNSILRKSTGMVRGSVGDEVANTANESNVASEAEGALNKRGRLKENVDEILQAGKDLDAPVMEGMVSADPWVQKAEDALVNGAPTFSGIKRAKLYERAYDNVEKTLTGIVGEPEVSGGMSKAQLGSALEQSLGSGIEQESAPLNSLYREIQGHTADVLISPRSLPRIAENIMNLDAVRVDPDGPGGALARRMIKNIENIKSVDDVKALRKVLNEGLSATASNSERYVMGEISDRLKDLERNAVRRYGEGLASAHEERLAKLPEAQALEEKAIWDPKINAIKGLIGQMDAADKAYAPFITKIKTLAKMLGKKNISGAQGAINFITTELSPEQLATRAFQKGSSEMAEFFAKNFPNEWELVKQYQKGLLRDDSVVERTGQFNSRMFLKKIDKLEPEIQKLLFSPDELKKINAAKTYLRSIPESYNPSGTSHTSAFREFFEHPTGALVANARDFGIEAFIKAMGKMPAGQRPNPIELGSALADKFNKFNAARNLVESLDDKMQKAARAIFTSKSIGDVARNALISGGTQEVHSFDERVKRVSELASNANLMGSHMANHIEPINKAMPDISQNLQYSMLASAQYLNSKVPRPSSHFMLSTPWQPSAKQKQEFNQYYDAVNDPLKLLGQLKTGSVNHETLEAVQATHPQLLNDMRTQVLKQMTTENIKQLSYKVKCSLAKFLGEPLDSSMLPSVIISNQMAFNGPPSPNGQSPKQQRSTQSGLSKLKIANRSATDVQDLEEGDSK